VNGNYNFAQLEAAISQATTPQRRKYLKSKVDLFWSLVSQAIDLGLPERIARRRSPNWLIAFITTQQAQVARNQQLLGSAGLEASAGVRRRFGV